MPSLPQVRIKSKRRTDPQAVPVATFGPRELEVEAALERLRPAVREDGGDIELVRIDDDTVTIRFLGACVGCPSSEMTLRDGVERHLIAAVDGIKHVVAVEE
ncbi:MAG: NifU family protein [Planctomycetota bacterium]